MTVVPISAIESVFLKEFTSRIGEPPHITVTRLFRPHQPIIFERAQSLQDSRLGEFENLTDLGSRKEGIRSLYELLKDLFIRDGWLPSCHLRGMRSRTDIYHFIDNSFDSKFCFVDKTNRIQLATERHGDISRTRRSAGPVSFRSGPGVAAPVRAGHRECGTKTMHEDTMQGLETSATADSSDTSTFDGSENRHETNDRDGIRVVCRDCDFEDPRWHPDLEAFEGARHGHDLRTDHEVAYEATNDRVRTDGGQVEACPNCDSPRINERVSDRYDDDERYRCVECQATFPNPVVRASRLPENRRYTDTYRALRDAGDLDDLRADGGVDMVDACPECDSPVITKHVGGMHRPIDDPPSYRCRDCKTLFDEPVQREPHRDVKSVGNLSEAGRALVDADPDDFEIRTDGGSIADDLDELCSVDGQHLKRRDTIEHLDLGPLTVKQRLQTGPDSARIRFDVESTKIKRPRLIVEYTLRELREEWGKTVHSDPTVLVSGGDGDGGDDLVTDGGRDEFTMAIERQTDVLEELVEETRHQNAVLTELAHATWYAAVSANEYTDPDERAEHAPSVQGLRTNIEDQAFTREEGF